jgi:hypothetical protein
MIEPKTAAIVCSLAVFLIEPEAGLVLLTMAVTAVVDD